MVFPLKKKKIRKGINQPLKVPSIAHNKEKGRTNFSHAAFLRTYLGQNTTLILRVLYTWIVIVYAQVRRNKRKEKANNLNQDYVEYWFQEVTNPSNILVSKMKSIFLTTCCMN